MDYYGKFQADVAAKTKELIAQRADMIQVIATAEKNLSRERERVAKFKNRITRLKELSTETLTSKDDNSFEKFKVSLRKVTTDLDTSEELCRIFEDDILPKKKDELHKIRRSLSDKFNACFTENKHFNDNEVYLKIESAIQERTDYAAAFSRMRIEAGCGASGLTNPPSRRQFHGAYEAFRITRTKQAAEKAKLAAKTAETKPKPPFPTGAPEGVSTVKPFLTGESDGD